SWLSKMLLAGMSSFSTASRRTMRLAMRSFHNVDCAWRAFKTSSVSWLIDRAPTAVKMLTIAKTPNKRPRRRLWDDGVTALFGAGFASGFAVALIFLFDRRW